MELFLIGMITGFLLCVLVLGITVGIQIIHSNRDYRKRYPEYAKRRKRQK